jgi:hypothetical protein
MEMRSVPENTPKPTQLVIVEFLEAQHYLADLLRQRALDTDPQFTHAILQLIVKEVLDYANMWVDTSSLEDAVEELQRASGSQDFAFDVARHLHDMVQIHLTRHLPDFSLERYAGKYTYDFIGGLNARVQIKYWVHGIPGHGPDISALRG